MLTMNLGQLTRIIEDRQLYMIKCIPGSFDFAVKKMNSREQLEKFIKNIKEADNKAFQWRALEKTKVQRGKLVDARFQFED